MTPFSVVGGPEAWKAADYQDTSKYMYIFSDADIVELDSAIAAVQERGLDIKVGLLNKHPSATVSAAICICCVRCQEHPCMASSEPADSLGACVGRSV